MNSESDLIWLRVKPKPMRPMGSSKTAPSRKLLHWGDESDQRLVFRCGTGGHERSGFWGGIYSSTLTGTNFGNANLTGVDFTELDLTSSFFNGANVTDVIWGVKPSARMESRPRPTISPVVGSG